MTDTAKVHGDDFQCPVIAHNPAENEQHKIACQEMQRPSIGSAPWSRGAATDDHEEQELGSTSHPGLDLGPFGPLHTKGWWP
ncbi:hypothetical protein PGTUg99_006308 [Puccinia graminis f. sp. tritici]|uniref:Uncharacterized protein n=1 Tax=Puccinia graminis f. sp. tritici TaxID=56615 RepID=A0A5B0RJV1_PUCGR|nr:hypothetical protein PGTUg99_006308 [Puccinia graminis f. sp. tritici]